jgi:lipoyl(octanoyl) transferase
VCRSKRLRSRGDRTSFAYICVVCRTLDALLIDVVVSYGLPAGRLRHFPGVWAGDHKIAAINTVDLNGVTQHGFALNVATDLSYFDKIVPCGIRDRGVGSLSQLAGQPISMEEVIGRAVEAFGRVFGVGIRTPEAAQPYV